MKHGIAEMIADKAIRVALSGKTKGTGVENFDEKVVPNIFKGNELKPMRDTWSKLQREFQNGGLEEKHVTCLYMLYAYMIEYISNLNEIQLADFAKRL